MIQKSIIPMAIITAVGGVGCTPTTQTAVYTPQPKQEEEEKEIYSKKYILQQMTKIITKNLMIDKNDITLKSNFTDDLGADSLDTVELIMAFEEEFSISIPDSDLEKMKTVEDALEFVYKKVNQK